MNLKWMPVLFMFATLSFSLNGYAWNLKSGEGSEVSSVLQNNRTFIGATYTEEGKARPGDASTVGLSRAEAASSEKVLNECEKSSGSSCTVVAKTHTQHCGSWSEGRCRTLVATIATPSKVAASFNGIEPTVGNQKHHFPAVKVGNFYLGTSYSKYFRPLPGNAHTQSTEQAIAKATSSAQELCETNSSKECTIIVQNSSEKKCDIASGMCHSVASVIVEPIDVEVFESDSADSTNTHQSGPMAQ